MATNVWKADIQSFSEDIFLGVLTGSNVNCGLVVAVPFEGAVNDKEYLSGLGDVSKRDPKSMNSSAQILVFKLLLILLPKGTAIL